MPEEKFYKEPEFWHLGESPEIGQLIKVILPEERPWAIINKIIDERIVVARIDNHLVATDNHGIQVDDFVLCHRDENHAVWAVLGKFVQVAE